MNKIYYELVQDHYCREMFIKRNEYTSDCPQSYWGDINNMKFNVLFPEVSKHLLENKLLHVLYPDDKKFAICLTHDVDDIYPPLTHRILASASFLGKGSLKKLYEQWAWLIKGKKHSPYINFKQIIDLEKKYNAKSSFYFLATNQDPRRFRYHFEEIDSDLKYIIESGWEIGLHGGYYSYNNLASIKKEKNKLEKIIGKEIIGYRNHYLKFKVPETWKYLQNAGFKYDTTFGYNDMPGFRNGMCHPFRPFNMVKEKEIDILEIPLNIMVSSLFEYTKSLDNAWNLAKQLIDTVLKYHGVLTILWHNDELISPFWNNRSILYEKILEYGYQKNAWMTSGEEIWRWWSHDH